MRQVNSLFSGNSKKIYLTAFLLPAAVALLIYLVSGIWPIGDQCFLKTDMYHQYIPFLSEFRKKLLTGGSLLFTWDVGLGVNFLALAAYYLSSPLNLLLVFCPENCLIEFMTLLMIVKLGLCSVTFTWYLCRHREKPDAGYAFFGTFFALSGYMCAYYWNLMWLDCIILFPVVVGGLEKLIEEEKPGLYLVSLGLCIFSNYYISIMICIFLVLWFFLYNLLERPENRRAFLRRGLLFAVSSLLAGGMSAVLLLPAFFALRHSASSSSRFPENMKEYFSILQMLGRMLPAVDTEQVLEHWPNIYSGTPALLLVPLYVCSGRIDRRKKLIMLGLALFLLAGFSLNFMEYIWHGFHYPNSLPARQSFLFVFVILCMCADAYAKKDSFTRKQIAGALAAAVLFILYTQDRAEDGYYHIYTFYLAIVLCVIYALLLSAWKAKKIAAGTLFLLALCTVFAETAVNSAVTSFTTCSRSYYTKNNQELKSLAQRAGEEADGDFYRVERVSRLTKNDGAWLHFPAASLFSSTASASVGSFLGKTGCEASTNAYSITGSTPLMDMLLSVGYRLTEGGFEEAGKDVIASEGEVNLYRNRSVLSVGFLLPEKITEEDFLHLTTPEMVQNAFCDDCGTGHVLREQTGSVDRSGSGFSVTIEEDGEYYAYSVNTAIKTLTVYFGEKTRKFENLNRKYLMELGELKKGDKIRFTSQTEGETVNIKILKFQYDALEELHEVLARGEWKCTAFSDTEMEGTVLVPEEGYGKETGKLYFSIPFDAGWKAFVDGVRTETMSVFGDAFLCVEVPRGQHTVRLSYTPEGFLPGLILTLASLCLSAVFLLCCGKVRKNRKEREDNKKTESLSETPEEIL